MLGDSFSTGFKNDSRLIRKAYLDVLGTVPTAEETDWYCVYNSDGYVLAVDWLLKKYQITHKHANLDELREFLLSTDYREASNIAIPKKKIEEIIFYVAGCKYDESLEALNKAKLRLVVIARSWDYSDLDTIDYLAYELMGRVTNKDEANSLLQALRVSLQLGDESVAWLALLEQVLKLDDVRSK